MIAGSSIVLARIAAWEFLEPLLVTKPRRFSFLNLTVSLGRSSGAAIITGSFSVIVGLGLGRKVSIRVLAASIISKYLCCKYSSSSCLNMSASLRAVLCTANSALSLRTDMQCLTFSTNLESCNIMIWVLNMADSFSPSCSREDL